MHKIKANQKVLFFFNYPLKICLERAPTFVLRTVPFVFGKIFTRDGSRKVCKYTQCNEKSQLQAKWEMGPSFRPGACCKQTFATFIFVIMTLEWAISGKVERLLNIWPGNGNA